MARTGINAYKRRDGRWEGRFFTGRKESGQIHYGYVYGRTFGEVRRKLKTAETAVPQTISGKFNPTFADISELWLINASLRIKPSTCANYRTLLISYIIPAIGGSKISVISAAAIDRFSKDMLTSGRKDGKGGLSPKTVRDVLSVIKSVLDYARNENIKVADFKFTYPKRDKPRARTLTKKEQSALEKVLTDDADEYKAGILLSLFTGLRIGEVCALKQKDIILGDKGGVILVNRTLQRVRNTAACSNDKKTRILIDTPKSTSGTREIPLPSFLVNFLSRFLPDKTANDTNGDTFFLSGKAHSHTEPRTLQNRFNKYIKAAGIAPVNFHTTRHTFATRCVEAGMDVKSLSEILGHANVKITLDRYVHSSFEQKRVGVERLKPPAGISAYKSSKIL